METRVIRKDARNETVCRFLWTELLCIMNLPIKYTPSEYEMKMFQEMEGKYVSENEKVFFETMLRKIQTEYASHTETILDDNENPDGIYLYREIYDDFRIGRWIEGLPDTPVMINGLFGLLTQDMESYHILGGHKTLWEWLWWNDYQYVHYDRCEG